mmetsp:Transcript_27711/g.65129  ORF Transcript_27711/g.65129 Transcript_27711/m.65129 type:complete len:200 (-) Transcript_27711:944-1543(-)
MPSSSQTRHGRVSWTYRARRRRPTNSSPEASSACSRAFRTSLLTSASAWRKKSRRSAMPSRCWSRAWRRNWHSPRRSRRRRASSRPSSYRARPHPRATWVKLRSKSSLTRNTPQTSRPPAARRPRPLRRARNCDKRRLRRSRKPKASSPARQWLAVQGSTFPAFCKPVQKGRLWRSCAPRCGSRRARGWPVSCSSGLRL